MPDERSKRVVKPTAKEVAALRRAEQIMEQQPPSSLSTQEAIQWMADRNRSLTPEERAAWLRVHNPEYADHLAFVAAQRPGWRTWLTFGNLVRFGAFWAAVGLLIRYLT